MEVDQYYIIYQSVFDFISGHKNILMTAQTRTEVRWIQLMEKENNYTRALIC